MPAIKSVPPASVQRYERLNRFITISTLMDIRRESAAPISRYIHKRMRIDSVLSKEEDNDVGGQKARAMKV